VQRERKPPRLVTYPGISAWQAVTAGYLIFRGGCTFEGGPDGKPGHALAWPEGTTASLDEDGNLRVRHREGPVIRENEFFAASGGSIGLPRAKREWGPPIENVPVRCLTHVLHVVGEMGPDRFAGGDFPPFLPEDTNSPASGP
jgi:hypothetical protein